MPEQKYLAQRAQFAQALERLKEAVRMEPNDIVRDSAIQRFEFTLDLGWKTLKTFLEETKGLISTSPKECFREAYRQHLISNDEEWLALVDMRNETVHTYDEATAEKIFRSLPDAIRAFETLLGIFQSSQ